MEERHRGSLIARNGFLVGAPGTEMIFPCGGIELVLGWIWQHETGIYFKFTDSGAALFA